VGGAPPPPPEGTPEYHEWAERYAHLRPDVQAEVARVRASRGGLGRWVVRPLLLGVGLWSGWQIGQTLVTVAGPCDGAYSK